ncbi:hypothetical protein ACHAXT_003645 [Thalassiosira profunda]
MAKCTPTTSLAWGPIWFPGQPLLDGDAPKICRGEDDGKLMLASSIFSRSLVDVGSVQLAVSGRVLDEECNPVAGAIVDVWSPDSKGRYSLTPDGECRGAVLTDEEGRYSFLTHMPGSYGITAGCGHRLYGTELIPYSLRHIHIAVFAKGHKLMVTQLTFPDDPTRGYDFREVLSPEHALSDVRMQLDIVKQEDGSHAATFDFIIETDASATEDLFANTEALKEVVCVAKGLDLGEPYPLCQTGTTTLGKMLSIERATLVLLPTMLYTPPVLAVLVVAYVLRKIASVFGGSVGSAKKTKAA